MMGSKGGRYTESDDSNMQIEQVGKQFFLDKWVQNGWKNIAVFNSYDAALEARSQIRQSETERHV